MTGMVIMKVYSKPGSIAEIMRGMHDLRYIHQSALTILGFRNHSGLRRP